MDDALGFHVGEGFAHFVGDIGAAQLAERAVGADEVVEGSAADELHGHEVDAAELSEVVQGGDVGMVELGVFVGFAEKCREELAVVAFRRRQVEDFEGYVTRGNQGGVDGMVDGAEAAGAKPVAQVVAAGEAAAECQAHVPGDGRLLLADGDGDLGEEFAGLEGLHDVLVGAAGKPVDDGLLGVFGGDDDDGDVEGVESPAKLFEGIHAGHAGHVQIEDDEVEGLLVEAGEHFAAALAADHVVAALFEETTIERVHVAVVVRTQDRLDLVTHGDCGRSRYSLDESPESVRAFPYSDAKTSDPRRPRQSAVTGKRLTCER